MISVLGVGSGVGEKVLGSRDLNEEEERKLTRI